MGERASFVWHDRDGCAVDLHHGYMTNWVALSASSTGSVPAIALILRGQFAGEALCK
ncbi:hypothetical protein [Granulicella sp. dw_53]|uniref:hypothetical protein n=1 Tax=Granulicella sp. dw_53 TaxID=2719792 RepID=UPI001BD48274|nr:hypothetical protein [Granulicella sp. dw_53]